MWEIAAAWLSVAFGALATALLLAALWTFRGGRIAWLNTLWAAAAWIAATAAALALLGYGVARLVAGGAATVHSAFFYAAFLVAFTVALGAAARLMLLRVAPGIAAPAGHYVLLVLLVAYAALVYLWVPGTLMAALSPALVVLVEAAVVVYVRERAGAASRRAARRDLVFGAMLLLLALGPLLEWFLCLGGARDLLWGVLELLLAIALPVYFSQLPAPARPL